MYIVELCFSDVRLVEYHMSSILLIFLNRWTPLSKTYLRPWKLNLEYNGLHTSIIMSPPNLHLRIPCEVEVEGSKKSWSKGMLVYLSKDAVFQGLSFTKQPEVQLCRRLWPSTDRYLWSCESQVLVHSMLHSVSIIAKAFAATRSTRHGSGSWGWCKARSRKWSKFCFLHGCLMLFIWGVIQFYTPPTPLVILRIMKPPMIGILVYIFVWMSMIHPG